MCPKILSCGVRDDPLTYHKAQLIKQSRDPLVWRSISLSQKIREEERSTEIQLWQVKNVSVSFPCLQSCGEGCRGAWNPGVTVYIYCLPLKKN